RAPQAERLPRRGRRGGPGRGAAIGAAVSCATPRYIRLVDKLFVRGLGRGRWRELRGHLAECERCRSYYDRVARVWQAMGPGETPGETVVRGAASTAHAGPPALLRCRLEDALQFAYTLGPGAGEYLVVVGEDAGGQLHWYSAPPDAGPAIALQPGAQEEPLQ